MLPSVLGVSRILRLVDSVFTVRFVPAGSPDTCTSTLISEAVKLGSITPRAFHTASLAAELEALPDT